MNEDIKCPESKGHTFPQFCQLADHFCLRDCGAECWIYDDYLEYLKEGEEKGMDDEKYKVELKRIDELRQELLNEAESRRRERIDPAKKEFMAKLDQAWDAWQEEVDQVWRDYQSEIEALHRTA